MTTIFKVQDPRTSLRNVLATSPRDWGQSPDLAWVYGVVVGWDAASLRELAAKFAWTSNNVHRLRELHRVFKLMDVPK